MKPWFFLILCLCAFPLRGFAAGELLTAEADQLFARRDEVQSLERAIQLVNEALVKDASAYDLQWRLARLKYYLADRAESEAQKLYLLKEARENAEKAVEINPRGPEGHFWQAATLGGYAEKKGILASLRSLPIIRQGFENVLKLAPAYEHGSAFLALGEMFLRLPSILGGDNRRGLELLENGLKIAPENHEIKLKLASVYLQKKRPAEARQLLVRILKETDPALTARETAEIRAEAQKALKKIG